MALSEDNGTPIREIDPTWKSGHMMCCNTDPDSGWFCTLSENHTSYHHVAHGDGLVLARWPSDSHLHVADGL